MRVVGSFNKISEKLKKELIKPVKPGTMVYFQLLNGHFDPHLGREGFGASKSIRLSDTILDPYAKEEKNDKGEITYIPEYVEIGVPEDGKIKNGVVERCKKYWVESIANGLPGNGQFYFTGGVVADMETYEFLCLSNGSQQNKYRDTSKDPQYKMVDVEGERKEQEEKDFRELQNKLNRFTKNNPERAAELLKGVTAKTPA